LFINVGAFIQHPRLISIAEIDPDRKVKSEVDRVAAQIMQPFDGMRLGKIRRPVLLRVNFFAWQAITGALKWS